MAVSLAAAIGCGSSGGGPTGCNSDQQCTAAGARCVDHACQIALVVQLLSPADATFTNSTAPVPVHAQVLNGAPAAVAIWLDDAVKTTVGPNQDGTFSYPWDTTGVAEGEHRLWARVDAGAQHYESPVVTVTVDRHAPAPPVFTSAATTTTASPTVSGTAEPGATVTVRESGTALGTATATEGGSWTIALSGLSEGTHALTAVATDLAGNVSIPGARSLVVDLTIPTIVSRTPARNAPTIWSRDDVVVAFSEPIAPSTVGHATVRLTDNAGGLTVIPELSPDGLTLTIHPPNPLPPVPNHLTLALDGLTDLSGQHLAAQTWGWDLPEWLELASPRYVNGETVWCSWSLLGGRSPKGVISWGDGYPVAHASVLLWDGTEWIEALPGLRRNAGSNATGSIAAAAQSDSSLFLAYSERLSYGDPYQLYVDRYDVSSRQRYPLGGAVNDSSAESVHGQIVRVDAAGMPVVLWAEGSSGAEHLFVSRWNGTSWDALGHIGPITALKRYDLALAGTSRVTVGYLASRFVTIERVRGSQVTAPGRVGPVTEFALAMDEAGVEMIAFSTENASGAQDVWTAQPRPGMYQDAWEMTGPISTTAVPGVDLVSRPNAPSGQRMALSYGDPSGPCVLFDAGGSWVPLSSNPKAPRGNITRLATSGDVLSAWWVEYRGPWAGPTVLSMFYNR